MGTTDEVVRFRSGAAGRWAGIALGLACLGLWSWNIARTGETEAVPFVVALSVLVAGGLWFLADRVVVLTADAIVMRSYRGTTTLPWTAIGALQRRGTTVWALTEDGWFVLPVDAGVARRGDRGDRCGPTLGDAVWFTWLARRRADWALTDLRPWTPNRDLRGRAVLRPPLHTRLGRALAPLGALLGTTVGSAGTSPLGPRLFAAAVLLAATLSLALTYHAWSRVTIDPEEVVVRSLGGVARVRRDHIVGLEEDSHRFGLGSNHHTRLALVSRRPVDLAAHANWRPLEVIALLAPATGDRWWDDEPAYHRIWAWLHDELVAKPDAVAPATDALRHPAP